MDHEIDDVMEDDSFPLPLTMDMDGLDPEGVRPGRRPGTTDHGELDASEKGEKESTGLALLPLDTPFDLSMYFPRCSPTMLPLTVNCLGNFWVPEKIDLKLLAWKCRNVEYNPGKNKNMLVMKLREPQCTAIVLAGGSVRIVGARNSLCARLAAKKAAKIIRKATGMQFDSIKFSLVSNTLRVDLKAPIRLSELAEQNSGVCVYEPDVFSGCVVRLEGRIKALVFVTGKVIITGPRDSAMARRAFMTLVPMLAAAK